MPVVLYNPTNEEFKPTFGGRRFIIDAEGGKVKVDDSCGRHVLNEYGPRGLMRLDFGDEDKLHEIASSGREKNRAFKTRQIEVYNQRNEERKAIGLPFLTATKTLIGYAHELGLKLSEPYRVDDTVAQKSLVLEEENKTLKAEIKELRNEMSELMKAVKDIIQPAPQESEIPAEAPKKRGPKPKAKK